MQIGRRWAVAAVISVALGFSAAAPAAELLELGVRFDLALHPVRVDGEVRWDLGVGAYGLVRLGPAWGARAAVGYDVANAGPYASLGLGRTVVESVILEGDLTFQWNFRARSSMAHAEAGVRFRSRPDAAQRSSLAIFPASWTFNAVTGQPLSFSFTPSFTGEAALVLESGLLLGEAATITFLRVPAGSEPTWPIGGGGMLAARLTSHLGYHFAAGL